MRLKLPAIALVLIALTLSVSPALSGSKLVVYTLKKAYEEGEVVTIVVKTSPWAEVGVEVINPLMRTVYADQGIANLTGMATFRVLAVPDLWPPGKYVVYASTPGVYNTTTFSIVGPG
ncbi:MAG: hypothetical protein DRO06_01925 [Thermoproteota archaeon]|nr:MAG: hypothetical protein DRO06_01925 [Candidatus Korarchaeota archaeon]